MEIRRRFYVTSVSSTSVVLSPEPSATPSVQAGTNVQQVTVTTSESTANAAFWGATGQCGRYEVIVRKVS